MFGKVTTGMEVVEKIGQGRRPANAGPHQNVPVKPIVIESASTCWRRSNPRRIRMIKLHTNHGVITVELDADKAPQTVANFLEYVEAGHYDNTVFHRVIDGFMIQGGGFEPGMKQKPTRDPVKNEADNGLKNDVGTLAMARTSDPHSATAQFFINVADNELPRPPLADPQGWGYCVFGKVVERHGRGRQDQGRENRPQRLPPGRAGRRCADRARRRNLTGGVGVAWESPPICHRDLPLHLRPAPGRCARRASRSCCSASCADRRARRDSLYILGDLFEYWVGDDDLDDPLNRDVAAALHEVADQAA